MTPAEERSAKAKREKLRLRIVLASCIVLLSAASIAVLAWLPGPAEQLRVPTTFAGRTEPRIDGPDPSSPARTRPSAALEPIVLKARAATIHGEAKLETEPQKDCIGFWYGNDAQAQWSFRVGGAGVFEVELTYAGDQTIEGNEYSLAVAGQQLTGKVKATGSWSRFVPDRVGTVSIPREGRYSLSIKPLKKGPRVPLMNLQAVTLRPVRN